MTSSTVHQPRMVDSTERAIEDEVRRRAGGVRLTVAAYVSVIGYGLMVGFIAVMAVMAR